MSSKKKSKGYLVRRALYDMGPNGPMMGLIKVDKPEPGETIYRGKFKPRTIYGGPHDAEAFTVYDYQGEGEPKTEVWEGDGADSKDEF